MALVKKNSDNKFKNSRLRYLIAALFLLGLAMGAKLYFLQIIKADFYSSKADKQQRVATELLPSRGQIWVNNYSDNMRRNDLSLLATARNFATIYAVPKDLSQEQANFIAIKLDEIFGVDEVPDDYQINSFDLASTSSTTATSASSTRAISYYLSRLQKANDPYEVLVRKSSDKNLLHFYAAILNLPSDSLELRGGRIYKKGENDSGSDLSYFGIGFDLVPQRYYPENNLGAHLLGFVNYENQGNYGLEEYFNRDLKGQEGYLKGSRSAVGSQVVRVGNEDYIKPENGSDLVLTIDRAVQFFICKKLGEGVGKYKFVSGLVIVAEPKSGAIVALCSWPDYNPNDYSQVDDANVFMNSAISSQYEPGSVFKVITMAAALDQGKVSPNTTYNDTGRVMISGWPKPISNSDYETNGAHGVTDMTKVLNLSLNTGAIFAMEQIGAKVFGDYVSRFGFGRLTDIDLAGESKGDIRSLSRGDKTKPIDAATASFGQGIAVTPMQMLMSYAAIANNGILMRPYLVKEIVKPDSSKVNVSPQEVGRVISERSARTLRAMLADVVENGHSKRAGVSGYYVGGKTGTAQIPSPQGGYLTDQYIHTFVGMAPVDDPRFVMLVKLDRPYGIKFAESSAAPLFGEIADFLLKYYQIPKER